MFIEYIRPFANVISFKCHNSAKESVIYPHFGDEENEVEGGKITCLSLPSW